MPYIDQITIHNFKSFRQATIKFSEGFTCIVGPNGSGKSNICDSLLFALGESSLRRMRAQSVSSLINTASNQRGSKQVINKSYVSVHINGQELTITRSVNHDNKISYRVNGKRVTRQEMLDALRLSNSIITEANTITQDEINAVRNLNPKERRVLIDIAAGIKEFDDKKEMSLKELDRVEERITSAKVQLSERSGFLEELKRERDDAEAYIKLRDSIKSITYTILKGREEQLGEEYRILDERVGTGKRRAESLRSEISELDAEMKRLSEHRTEISKRLNERSIEMNRTNRGIEEVSKNIAVIDSKIESKLANLTELKRRMEQAESERRELELKVNEDRRRIAEIRSELSPVLKALESLEGVTDSLEEAAMLQEYEKNQVEIERGKGLASNLIDEIERTRLAIHDLEVSDRNNREAIADLERRLSKARSAADGIDIPALREVGSKLSKELKLINQRVEREREEVQGIDYKIIELREAIAGRGGDLDKVTNILRAEVDGVIGRVYELFTYDERYTNAVYAAAGGRMNYIVVDSVETADRAIGVLKRRSLGRVSFIPLSDIRVNAAKAERGVSIISLLKFDKRVERAISFVFSNTMLVESISEVKRREIGLYRYVTIGGELLEQSGVVTGGQIRVQIPSTKIYLELDSLNERKRSHLKAVSDMEVESDSVRRSIGKWEMEMLNAETQMSSLSSEIRETESSLKDKRERVRSVGEEIGSLNKILDRLTSDKDGIVRETSALEGRNRAIHTELTKRVNTTGTGSNNERVKEKAGLRARADKLNFEIASLSKEVEVFDSRIGGIRADADSLSLQIRTIRGEIEGYESGRNSAMAERLKLEESIKAHDSTSAKIYAELSAVDSGIQDINRRKGEISISLDRIERELIESNASVSQIATRLSDIKAELAGYSDTEMVRGGLGDLERELASLKARLESLGNVNLKAPEMYEIRSRDVREAGEKLSVLESERGSIISMIDDIESRKLSVFNETFESVNQNFKRLYSQINEGEASLILMNSKNPFESGLSITTKGVRGRSEMIESKSGGEKAMLIILLMLSIQMRKPMAFYIFDEIDAPLDKQNSKKLSLLFKNLGKRSQFIVVSHNDTLISNADAVIGVTKSNGESKALGLQLVSQSQQSVHSE